MTETARASSPPEPIGRVALRVYLGIGLALVVLGVGQLLAQPESVHWVALVAVLMNGAAVAALPRATLLALVGMAAAIVTMVAVIEVPVFATFVAVMVAAFTLARYADLRTAAAGYVVLLATVIVVAQTELAGGFDGLFGLVYPVFYFGGAGLLGWWARKRAEHVRSVLAYAEILEREQHQRAELAAAAERERLARDMHDVISHGVSLMVLQAEAAREVLYDQPAAAGVALDAIAEAGRRAMSDLHRMVGVLRGPAYDLDALAESVRVTGLRVDLRVEGDWALVDEPTRAAVFRVAQESLTNTLRHASGAEQAAIDVVCNEGSIAIEVIDDGRVDALSGGGLGSGLRGLNDRLTALGGSLVAGPRTDGPGFRVSAWAPRSVL